PLARRESKTRRGRCRAQFLALCRKTRGGGLQAADRNRGRGERAWCQGRGGHGRLRVQRGLGQAAFAGSTRVLARRGQTRSAAPDVLSYLDPTLTVISCP